MSRFLDYPEWAMPSYCLHLQTREDTMPRDKEGHQNRQRQALRDRQPAQGAQDRQGKDRPQGKAKERQRDLPLK
ncbi:MAG: hypothetical protein K0S16_1608 [Moraxellaceae bacterium]|nr:hypothetical protein [Moraxellaceae bacterium]